MATNAQTPPTDPVLAAMLQRQAQLDAELKLIQTEQSIATATRLPLPLSLVVTAWPSRRTDWVVVALIEEVVALRSAATIATAIRQVR